ncbi:hypothetical protein AASFL403_10810 [Paenibacillus nuruki]|nr:hypothetical protein AASFL403_10810 [Paenibacillus nuruki]
MIGYFIRFLTQMGYILMKLFYYTYNFNTYYDYLIILLFFISIYLYRFDSISF